MDTPLPPPPLPGGLMDLPAPCMRVHVQGGDLKLLLPIPEPSQNITWLKNDFKLRALRRGKDGETCPRSSACGSSSVLICIHGLL